MWSMDKILRLEEENRAAKIKSEMDTARYRNQQQMINLQVNIISEQMKLDTLALFYGSLK